MGTKLTELRDGCFHRAMDDEPMFVLLARDASAPAKVRDWADERERDVLTGRKPASDMVSVHEARQCAERMEAWREQNDGAWRSGLFGAQTSAEPELPVRTFIGAGRRQDPVVTEHQSSEELDGLRRGMLGRDA